MNSLAVQVQQALKRDPHAGDLYVFRGKRGHLIKILWHDGIGMSLYAKRLERGRFIWPSPADGAVAITSAQLAYIVIKLLCIDIFDMTLETITFNTKTTKGRYVSEIDKLGLAIPIINFILRMQIVE